MALFEEHRYPMPFACLESRHGEGMFGATIFVIPSPLKNRNLTDQWWSLGVTAHDGYSELTLLSGLIAYNGQKSMAKALQSGPLEYNNTFITIEPRTVIEKTFYLDIRAKAVQAARRNDLWDAEQWELFLKNACDFAANRILSHDWVPRSSSEGFYIAPLTAAYTLFGESKYRDPAIKEANHYAERHLNMREPYWGGTLDAQCEDKEGAWASCQGFLAVYEMTGDPAYLKWARHACDVVLSYTVIWDIPLPPGRMSDHFFKTRGWTVVSPQNQHIDVSLAKVMFLSCGQLINPFGSQGEQLQQTNFAQQGNMTDIYKLRGGYSESWTVFWITAHFLNAAARFEEMGVAFQRSFL